MSTSDHKRTIEREDTHTLNPYDPDFYLTTPVRVSPSDTTKHYSDLYPLNFAHAWQGGNHVDMLYYMMKLSLKYPTCFASDNICNPKTFLWKTHFRTEYESAHLLSANLFEYNLFRSTRTEYQVVRESPLPVASSSAYIFIFLGLVTYINTEESKHANYLIFDPVSKKLYRIEPFGTKNSPLIFAPAVLDEKLAQVFGRDIYAGILPMRGLQEKEISAAKQFLDPDWLGFCLPWCIFILDYICGTNSKTALPVLMNRVPSRFRTVRNLVEFIAAYAWSTVHVFYVVKNVHSSFQPAGIPQKQTLITKFKSSEAIMEILLAAFSRVCQQNAPFLAPKLLRFFEETKNLTSVFKQNVIPMTRQLRATNQFVDDVRNEWLSKLRPPKEKKRKES